MKYLVTALAFAIAFSSCGKSKKEAYAEGCKAGIEEVLSQMGAQPNEPLIESWCKKASDDMKS